MKTKRNSNKKMDDGLLEEVEIIDLNSENGRYIRKRQTISDEERRLIVQCARNGDDLKFVSKHLGINIKTCRGIARRNRETGLKRGFKKRKFSDDVIANLRDMVDKNPSLSLKKIKAVFESENTGMTISATSIDRLLDCHGYSTKPCTSQLADRNRTDVKMKRANYARWLETRGRFVLRMYISETDFNIWCSRSNGRSADEKSRTRTFRSSKVVNLNIIACMCADGMLHYEHHTKINSEIFNRFLEACSSKVSAAKPDIEAAFIFENSPLHGRASEARLARGHFYRFLPPYSPFFNPIEEAFVCFISCVRGLLEENRDRLKNAPEDVAVRMHRLLLLQDFFSKSIQLITPSDCALYDMHNLTFIEPSINLQDL